MENRAAHSASECANPNITRGKIFKQEQNSLDFLLERWSDKLKFAAPRGVLEIPTPRARGGAAYRAPAPHPRTRGTAPATGHVSAHGPAAAADQILNYRYRPRTSGFERHARGRELRNRIRSLQPGIVPLPPGYKAAPGLSSVRDPLCVN